jgi:hypothetical protein
LRKMQSNARDQEKRCVFTVLWSGCGASDVRCREIPRLARVDKVSLRDHVPRATVTIDRSHSFHRIECKSYRADAQDVTW